MARTRRQGNVFVRLGVFLLIIGFGSVILHSATDYQFTLLMWADGMQPYIGIVVGLIGVGLLCSPFIVRARQQRAGGGEPVSPMAAFGQPQGFTAQPADGGPGQSTGFPPPQQFGRPGGFAPPGFQQPGGFPQQNGFPQPGFQPRPGAQAAVQQPAALEQQPTQRLGQQPPTFGQPPYGQQ